MLRDMTPYAGELVGTALLVLLGNAVSANLLLTRTRGEHAGGPSWLAASTGWAMALFVGLAIAAGATAAAGGAHLNPAVTIAFWQAERLPAASVPGHIAAQFIGAAIGAVLVYLLFLPHWGRTDDPARKLACFATAPAVRAPISNCFSEAIGGFVLVLGFLLLRDVPMTPAAGAAPSAAQTIATLDVDLGAIAAVPLALLFWALALGIGGTTGIGWNPARDLAPRLIHALAPIPGKGSSDWGYAWVPVVGPVIGGLLAVLAMKGVDL